MLFAPAAQTSSRASGGTNGYVLAGIFGLAIAARFLNLALIDDFAAHTLQEDARLYWSGADAWLQAGSFVRESTEGYLPETERVPIYFLFLLPFRWLFGDSVLPVLIGQAVVDAGTCVVIARIGAMAGRPVGITAGILAALWPNLIIHSSLLLTETVFVFLFSLMLLSCTRFLRDGRLADGATAGLLCGLAIMTRPVVQFLPIALAVAAPMIAFRHCRGWRRALASALVVLLFAALPVVPLVARNVTLFGSASLTSQAGTHVLHWVVGQARSIASGQPFEVVSRALNEKLRMELTRIGDADHRSNPFDRSRHTLEFTVDEFFATPPSVLARAWLQGAAINLAAPAILIDPRIRALNEGSFYNASGSGLVARVSNFIAGNDPKYVSWVVFGCIFGVIALALQGIGWIVLARSLPWAAVFAALAVAYFILINGPVASPKYRLPFEPVLIVLQALALSTIWERYRIRRLFLEGHA